MLNANPRQFFNYKMKGRRARIRNQKRSRYYRSGLDRSLDNYAHKLKQQKRKKSLSAPQLPLYRTKGLATEEKKSAKLGLVLILIAVGLFLII